jgi:ADP-heptose:LPS heptosyltransferase
LIKKKIDIYQNYLLKKKYNFEKKYIIIHLDEKWFSKYYYRDFTDINPNSKQIDIFINKILKITKTNFNLVFTNGAKKNDKLEDFYSTFTSNDKIIFNKKINDNLITYLPNLSFRDLESLVKDSSFLICCEGGISHVSHNFNISTVAFFEERRIQHMKFWTSHMDKLQLFPRKKMDDLLNDNNFFNLLESKLKQV